MFETILVPLDGSSGAERAARTAASLTGGDGRLVLAHVVPPSPALPRPRPGFVRSERRRAERYLRSVARSLRRKGLSVAFRTASGSPARSILALARREEADLIVLSTRGRGKTGAWPLGSTAERVLRAADRPVLLVRAARRPRKILVAGDRAGRFLRALPLAASAVRGAVTVALPRRGFLRADDVFSRMQAPHRLTALPGGSTAAAVRRMKPDLVVAAPGDEPAAEALIRWTGGSLLWVPNGTAR